jgi:hypothetical protein
LGCLLGNQTRDSVAFFFIGTPRSSELGSATNEKTQAVGPGFGFLVAVEPQISNFIEGYEMVVDLYKYMNRSPQHPDL